MSAFKKQTGFTLIELLIALGVMALLVSIALPSYRDQVAKGQRAQAKAVLLQAQQWMERFYSENYRYDKNLSNTAVTDSSLFYAQFSTAPPSGEGRPSYNISVSATSRTYTVTAARISTLSADKCGNFRITQTGRKSVVNYDTSKFSSTLQASRGCWQ